MMVLLILCFVFWAVSIRFENQWSINKWTDKKNHSLVRFVQETWLDGIFSCQRWHASWLCRVCQDNLGVSHLPPVTPWDWQSGAGEDSHELNVAWLFSGVSQWPFSTWAGLKTLYLHQCLRLPIGLCLKQKYQELTIINQDWVQRAQLGLGNEDHIHVVAENVVWNEISLYKCWSYPLLAWLGGDRQITEAQSSHL